jgi:hypothetical protein
MFIVDKKESIYLHLDCKLGLCVDACFQLLHIQLDFKHTGTAEALIQDYNNHNILVWYLFLGEYSTKSVADICRDKECYCTVDMMLTARVYLVS